MKARLGVVALYVALVLGAFLALGPMLWMLAASFMPTGEANSYPPRLLPTSPTLEHYQTLFTRLDLGRNLVNSAIVALAVTGLSTPWPGTPWPSSDFACVIVSSAPYPPASCSRFRCRCCPSS
jgi:ABC-type spermidine/putrescine transport system permease subunit II